MRLFLGIELPESVRTNLSRVIQELQRYWDDEKLPSASWVHPRNLHVTVKFFGEVSESEIPALTTALRTVHSDAQMGLRVDGPELFPPTGLIRVVAARVGGDVERARLLHDSLESRCRELGIAPESRPYRPHVTLSRCRSPLAPQHRRLLSTVMSPHLEGATFIVSEWELMESRLRAHGPEYVPLARFGLV
jgi:RNA 2',3'-cyclic 3'-phosphodiesterase